MTEDSLTDAERGAASSAKTLANMLELLDAAYGQRRPFSRFRRPDSTIRRLRRLATAPKISPRSYRLITRGFGEIEKYMSNIENAVNEARRTASSGVVTSVQGSIIMTADVESTAQALVERIKRLRDEIKVYFMIISEEDIAGGISPSLESLFGQFSPEEDE
jgi:hypothetical protein